MRSGALRTILIAIICMIEAMAENLISFWFLLTFYRILLFAVYGAVLCLIYLEISTFAEAFINRIGLNYFKL